MEIDWGEFTKYADKLVGRHIKLHSHEQVICGVISEITVVADTVRIATKDTICINEESGRPEPVTVTPISLSNKYRITYEDNALRIEKGPTSDAYDAAYGGSDRIIIH